MKLNLKKFCINLSLILIGFVIYFLQSNFFNWFSIGGIKPNLFIIYILFIGLFGTRSMSIIYASALGIFLDLIFNSKIGVNLFGYVLIGVIGTIFNKNFSKDSRITIMFMVFGTSIIFETVVYFINYVLYSINVEVMHFIKILVVEVIYNMIITIILYSPIQKLGYYIENEYKGNKILTKYF